MNSRPQWIIQANDAMKRAALRAREIAARTGTPVHVIREGKMVKLLFTYCGEELIETVVSDEVAKTLEPVE